MSAPPLPSSPAEAVTETDAPPAPGGFRTPVVRGIAWQLGARGTLQLTQILVVVLLAHLLTPHEFGIAGMVLVILSFEPILSGVGLASALIQRPVITEIEKSTVFWTNAAMGLLVCLLGVAVSGLVADFYGSPQIAPLFAAASLVFFVASLSSVQSQLLIREMDFRALELRSLVAGLVAAVAAIVIAAEGGGAWALIGQQLVLFGISLVLLWRFCPWRPRFIYSLETLRELRAFGSHVSGTMMMFQLTENTDNVLVGKFLGASALGLYSFAYSLIMLPFSRIAAPLIQVLYPVFSRVQEDRARLASQWLRSLCLMAAITLPAMFGLIVVAPDMVRVVFGPRWHGAVPVIQILAGVGLAVALQGLNAAVLQASGHTRLLFRYSCVLFVAGLTSFVIGLQWGIVGVAACFAAVNVLLQPVYLHLTARSMGIGLRNCVQALSGIFQATALAIGIAILTRWLLVTDGVPPTLRLLATISAAALIYVPALVWRAPEVVLDARQLSSRKRSSARADPAVA